MTRRVRSVIAASLALGAVVLASPLWMAAMGRFLVRTDAPAPSDAILVLAGDWTGARILEAAGLSRQGLAPVVLVSGPPNFFGRFESDAAIDYAVRNGWPRSLFVGIPHDADSTATEALRLAPELRRRGVRKLLVVTSDFHSRRAGRIWRATAPEMEIRVVTARFRDFDPSRWWTRRQWQKIFLDEWEKTVANWIGL